jgi:hypothetical protein
MRGLLRSLNLGLLGRATQESQDRRRPSSVAVRRSWYRQIAAYCSAYGTPSGRGRTHACATSVRRNTPTAHSIQSSGRWSEQRDLLTAIAHKPSSTSSTLCSRRPRPALWRYHSLQTCCRCRTIKPDHSLPVPRQPIAPSKLSNRIQIRPLFACKSDPF